MSKEVVVWIGAGEIGLVIIRRIGTGKQIIVADKSLEKGTERCFPVEKHWV